MRRRLALALAIGALLGALLPGIATATQSDTVASCKDGGWQQLVRAEDGSTFKNQGACVSYAAQGGTPVAPTPFKAICDRYGGAYREDSPASGIVRFVCEGPHFTDGDFHLFIDEYDAACIDQPGMIHTYSGFPVHCQIRI